MSSVSLEASSTSLSALVSTAGCVATIIVNVAFNELVLTSYGDSVYLVGSIPQLGSWSVSSGVAMLGSGYTTSTPLWSVTVGFPPGTSFQYKFVIEWANGTVEWEADPNHTLTVSSACASAATITESASWQS